MSLLGLELNDIAHAHLFSLVNDVLVVLKLVEILVETSKAAEHRPLVGTIDTILNFFRRLWVLDDGAHGQRVALRCCNLFLFKVGALLTAAFDAIEFSF